jgi:hypothetical protein
MWWPDAGRVVDVGLLGRSTVGRPFAADYRAGDLSANDWAEFRDELTAELEGGKAQLAQLDQRQDALASEIQQIDVESVVLRELTAIRSLVVGDVQSSSREGLDSLRVALRRLFERFELVPWGAFPAGGEGSVIWQGDTPLNIEAEKLVLIPRVRPEAIDWDSDQAEFPALRRVALSLRDNFHAFLVAWKASRHSRASVRESPVSACSVACPHACGKLRPSRRRWASSRLSRMAGAGSGGAEGPAPVGGAPSLPASVASVSARSAGRAPGVAWSIDLATAVDAFRGGGDHGRGHRLAMLTRNPDVALSVTGGSLSSVALSSDPSFPARAAPKTGRRSLFKRCHR